MSKFTLGMRMGWCIRCTKTSRTGKPTIVVPVGLTQITVDRIVMVDHLVIEGDGGEQYCEVHVDGAPHKIITKGPEPIFFDSRPEAEEELKRLRKECDSLLKTDTVS